MKMKVGEIEMSSSDGIHFGGRQSPTAEVDHARSSSAGLSVPSWSPGRFLFVAAAGGVGAILAILLALMTSIFLFLIPVPGLLLLSMAALFLAIRRKRPESSQEATEEISLSQVAIERRTRVFNLLSSADEPMTVERLQEELKWTEEALLSALRALLAQERITEDLDLDSGHWVYQLATAPLALNHESASTFPVQERLNAISAPVQVPHKE